MHVPDGRDTPGAGTYDKVISCEMIEAVGHEHLARYFATINAMLKPGGHAVIQVPLTGRSFSRMRLYAHAAL